jgi:hypothetical protein
MSPLERLFALEVEFHRKLRCEAIGSTDTSALHTSYALQLGYESLLRSVGRVTTIEVERLSAAADPRDVRAARASLIRLLNVSPRGG